MAVKITIRIPKKIKKVGTTMKNKFSGALQRFCAFTLAEMLIVLSLIGVLALLTMTTININTKKSEYRATAKQVLSDLNEAMQKAHDVGISPGNTDGSCCGSDDTNTLYDVVSNIFAKYLNINSLTGAGNGPITLILINGTQVIFTTDATSNSPNKMADIANCNSSMDVTTTPITNALDSNVTVSSTGVITPTWVPTPAVACAQITIVTTKGINLTTDKNLIKATDNAPPLYLFSDRVSYLNKFNGVTSTYYTAAK